MLAQRLAAGPLRLNQAPRVHHTPCSRRLLCVRAAAEVESTESQAPVNMGLSVTLRKPVGIIFSQKPGGPVYVEELVPGGAADRTGAIQVGDVLSKCSAVVLKAGKETGVGRGHGDRPYDNFEKLEFDCEGQEFNTVMSALKSNNDRWGIFDVTLVFRKP